MHTHSLTHAHTHSLTHTCTHTLSHMHTLTHAHTHIHARTHSHTHTCTHTLSHTHTHTLTYTHTQVHLPLTLGIWSSGWAQHNRNPKDRLCHNHHPDPGDTFLHISVYARDNWIRYCEGRVPDTSRNVGGGRLLESRADRSRGRACVREKAN